MSYIDNLKAIIDLNVYENHRNEVQANMVKAALISIVDMLFPQTAEGGWHLVDEQLNVALKYDDDGLDAAKVSDHFKSLLGGIDGGDFLEVVEDGFFFVDSGLNIGVYVDANGIHANNILEYQIVNI